MRATSQLRDSRSTPMTIPSTVAKAQPRTATSSVFSRPTKAARRCVDRDVYSISRWLMS